VLSESSGTTGAFAVAELVPVELVDLAELGRVFEHFPSTKDTSQKGYFSQQSISLEHL